MTKGVWLCYNETIVAKTQDERRSCWMEPLIKFWLFLCHWV